MKHDRSTYQNDPNIPFEFFKEYISRRPIASSYVYWSELTQHRKITMEDILSTLNDKKYFWAIKKIHLNPNFNEEFLERIFFDFDFYKTRYFYGGGLDWKGVSKNPGVGMKFILSTMYKQGFKWDTMTVILENPNFTLDFLCSRIDYVCGHRFWSQLVQREQITSTFIILTYKDPRFRWDIVDKEIYSRFNMRPNKILKKLNWFRKTKRYTVLSKRYKINTFR